MTGKVGATEPLRTELDPDIESLREASQDSGAPALVEISPDEARERVRSGNRLCSAGPIDVETYETVVPAGEHRVPVRVYGAADAGATLVYAHGGGWVTGDLDYSDELCRLVAARGVRVVSVDYRLAPEHRFPAAFEDMLAATTWASSQYGRIGVGGDSAGGNLAAAVTWTLRDSDAVDIAFQVLVYPVLDTSFTQPSYAENATAFPIGGADMKWFADHYVDLADRDDPRVAPGRARPLTGLPPTHVVAAGHDPLRDEAIAFAKSLDDVRVPVTLDVRPSLCHGFLRFTAVSPGAQNARDQLVERIVQLARSSRSVRT